MVQANNTIDKGPRWLITGLALLLLFQWPGFSQQIPDKEIQRRIGSYKADIRGPYKEIRWYCKDGTILPPQERCPEPGGVQRARHKEEVLALGVSNHLFLGQILATTPYPDFWDQGNYYSRLKQYEIEKYLQSIDNGWILRKAQFYRGAYQAEDEANWGVDFYGWLLADDHVLEENYFLIRQSMKDIPHRGDDNLTQNIRSLSKMISDTFPPFLDLRVKIHGQPDSSDLKKVEQFRESQRNKLDEDLLETFDRLIGDMRTLYKPVDMNALNKYLNRLSPESDLRKEVFAELFDYGATAKKNEKIDVLSRILYMLREGVLSVKTPAERVAAMDLSMAVERLLMRELSNISANTLREQLENISSLGMACAGCGYLEMWEWEQLAPMTRSPRSKEVPLETLLDFFEAGRRLTEWGTGMFRAQYKGEVERFSGFEALANGFMDDRVRSSLLLYYGNFVDLLGNKLVTYRPDSNHVMDIHGQSGIRGLNPGYAAGELVVITGQTTDLDVEKDKIYVFNSPPSDLKPVAGIATVSEGNMVSHVQLLARNLGIPNAVLSPQNLEDLKAFSGQLVFYAVSPGGSVVLKPLDQISPEEKKLIETRKRSQEKVSVPVKKIDLTQKKVIPLTEISARSSGVLCGPKAANLGQLKIMFPDHVVNGMVVPFGIFRMHLDQTMPGKDITYWQYLNGLFDQADQMRMNGASDEAVESYMLKELDSFRKSIREISLLEDFLVDLKSGFISNFDREMGKQPVFLRSDTNMEDLKDFTGAGLNLTVFNVVDYESILQGIRDVWASPYTERSYRWRQQYLLNPENVFPSILIIPSVDVECSGVMVTKGISNQEENDLTIAFNRGAGGAVDGQAAESYLLKNSGENLLISPAREPSYNRLPSTGGSVRHYTLFNEPVLNKENMDDLRILAEEIRKQLPHTPGIETSGPFDIELGFKDNNLWLFQVRPFVENKNAAASEYLNTLNPEYDRRMMIPLDQ
jgi:hypothetical protein